MSIQTEIAEWYQQPGRGEAGMTQIARVLAAFAAGSRTTPEVSAITGLPIKHCSAYARELVARGRLSDCGPVYHIGGRPSHWYEPKAGAPCP